jgi:hypothetical protein
MPPSGELLTQRDTQLPSRTCHPIPPSSATWAATPSTGGACTSSMPCPQAGDGGQKNAAKPCTRSSPGRHDRWTPSPTCRCLTTSTPTTHPSTSNTRRERPNEDCSNNSPVPTHPSGTHEAAKYVPRSRTPLGPSGKAGKLTRDRPGVQPSVQPEDFEMKPADRMAPPVAGSRVALRRTAISCELGARTASQRPRPLPSPDGHDHVPNQVTGRI